MNGAQGSAMCAMVAGMPRAVIVALARICASAWLALGLASAEGWPERAPAEPVLEPAPRAPDHRAAPPSRPTPLVTEEETLTVDRVVERGTGTFVAPPPAARSRALIATDAAGEVSLNVVDAELREVVRLVLEDALGVNYVIDPSVGGRITVQTTRPLAPEDLVPTLDAILRMNGAALIQSGDLYEVVPIDRLSTSGPIRRPPAAGRAPARLQRDGGAAPLCRGDRARRLLEPFARRPAARSRSMPTRNLLILAGTTEQLATLQELVGSSTSTGWRGCRSGCSRSRPRARPSSRSSSTRSSATPPRARSPGGPRGPDRAPQRGLVVSAQPAYLDQAETWVRRLDREGEGEEPQIYVYAVQNARATNLAEVLGEIFGARATTVGEPSLLAPGSSRPSCARPAFELGAEQTGTQLDEPDEATERERRERRARAGLDAGASRGALGRR